MERDERSDEESELEEDEGDGMKNGSRRQHKMETHHSKLVSLAENCVINNLTHQRRNLRSRVPRAR